MYYLLVIVTSTGKEENHLIYHNKKEDIQTLVNQYQMRGTCTVKEFISYSDILRLRERLSDLSELEEI